MESSRPKFESNRHLVFQPGSRIDSQCPIDLQSIVWWTTQRRIRTRVCGPSPFCNKVSLRSSQRSSNQEFHNQVWELNPRFHRLEDVVSIHDLSAIKNLNQTTQSRFGEEWNSISTLWRGSFSRRRPHPVEARFSLFPTEAGHQVANIDDDAARSIRCRNSFTSNVSAFESTSLVLRKKSKNFGISVRCADRGGFLTRSWDY